MGEAEQHELAMRVAVRAPRVGPEKTMPREQLVKLLMEAERIYVADLDAAIRCFRNVLADQSLFPSLPSGCLASVFGSLTEIFKFSEQFLFLAQ